MCDIKNILHIIRIKKLTYTFACGIFIIRKTCSFSKILQTKGDRYLADERSNTVWGSKQYRGRTANESAKILKKIINNIYFDIPAETDGNVGSK